MIPIKRRRFNRGIKAANGAYPCRCVDFLALRVRMPFSKPVPPYFMSVFPLRATHCRRHASGFRLSFQRYIFQYLLPEVIMAEKTNVIRCLEQKGIPFQVHNYIPTGAVSGAEAASALSTIS